MGYPIYGTPHIVIHSKGAKRRNLRPQGVAMVDSALVGRQAGSRAESVAALLNWPRSYLVGALEFFLELFFFSERLLFHFYKIPTGELIFVSEGWLSQPDTQSILNLVFFGTLSRSSHVHLCLLCLRWCHSQVVVVWWTLAVMAPHVRFGDPSVASMWG